MSPTSIHLVSGLDPQTSKRKRRRRRVEPVNSHLRTSRLPTWTVGTPRHPGRVTTVADPAKRTTANGDREQELHRFGARVRQLREGGRASTGGPGGAGWP